MSLVGPRPALFNQYELIAKRRDAGVTELRPGITGWAQVNGRDDVTDDEKLRLDCFYLRNHSVALDVKILLITVLKVVRMDGVWGTGSSRRVTARHGV